MLRSLLRRIPRFGFLTLFAAMLLFVSVAGWAKWNVDLWREEEALLTDIAEAGFGVTYRRGLAEDVETASIAQAASPRAWSTPIVDRFSRIEEIRFRNSAPEELLERAATLPYMRSVSGTRWLSGDRRRVKAISTEATAAIAGFGLTELPTPDRSAELAPLPRGESVEGEAKIPLIAKLVQTLDAEPPPPPKFGTIYQTYTRGYRSFSASDGETSFITCDGEAVIRKPQSYSVMLSEPSGFREIGRNDGPGAPNGLGERALLEPFVPAEALIKNLQTYEFDTRFRAALDDVEAIQVERIDERSYRFDLPAFVLTFTSAPCEDSHQISLIARSDLDWAIESWDMKGTRTGDVSRFPAISPIASLSCRSELRREQDWVVPDWWAVDYAVANLRSPRYPNEVYPFREAAIARYDFVSDVDLSHVTPELFDAKMLPPRRELPWLRWHRVTFGLSLALFAWVAVRRRVTRRRVAAVEAS